MSAPVPNTGNGQLDGTKFDQLSDMMKEAKVKLATSEVSDISRWKRYARSMEGINTRAINGGYGLEQTLAYAKNRAQETEENVSDLEDFVNKLRGLNGAVSGLFSDDLESAHPILKKFRNLMQSLKPEPDSPDDSEAGTVNDSKVDEADTSDPSGGDGRDRSGDGSVLQNPNGGGLSSQPNTVEEALDAGGNLVDGSTNLGDQNRSSIENGSSTGSGPQSAETKSSMLPE